MSKTQKTILPKRIAGFKIPKSLRKSRTLKAIAKNPMIVELASAALVAASSALAARDPETAKGTKAKARDIAAKVADEAKAFVERVNDGGTRSRPARGSAASPPRPVGGR